MKTLGNDEPSFPLEILGKPGEVRRLRYYHRGLSTLEM